MKADRLLKIIYTCLQRERVTTGELADKLEVSRRTIFRDLDALGAAGVPIVTFPGAGGGVGILEDFKLDRSLLTDDDFAKLTMALNSLHSIDGNRDIEFLMDKLIPPDKRRTSSSDIIIDLSSWFEGDGVDDMFADMRQAIGAQRLIELVYSTKGILHRRLVEPYKLVFKFQSWYLYGYCRMRGDFRVFKLTRVAEYRVCDEDFAARDLGRLEFRLQAQEEREHTAGSPVDVVLEYRMGDKEFLMDRMGIQGFQDGGEGGVIRFATTNLAWVADLVMGLQDKVRVLEPPGLVQEIRDRIGKMGAIYER